MTKFSHHRFFALVFAVVLPFGFLPARDGPGAAAATGPSTISTSSSDTVNFRLEALRVDEAAVLVVAMCATEAGTSTSNKIGSLELELDSRGRGGGCKGLERPEEGAIDSLADPD